MEVKYRKKVNMTTKVVIFLTYLIYSASCCDHKKSESIEDALNSLKNIVVKYDKNLDGSASFSELQGAIDVISTSMHGYRGTASKHLPRIQELNRNAQIGFTACVGPVYSWCVSMESVLELFLKRMESHLSAKDRRIIFRVASGLLTRGKNDITISLGLLQKLRIDLASLKDEFDAFLVDIHIDFSEVGEYGIYKKELPECHAVVTIKRDAAIAATFVHILFTVCLTIVAGPIGLALGLVPLFASAGLVVYFDNERRSIEYELNFIQKLFDTLDTKTHEALIILKNIKESLSQEELRLQGLQGYIDAAKQSGDFLLYGSCVQELAPSYRDLGNSCKDYAANHRHAVKTMNSRSRREAADECNVRRRRWTRAFEAYIPKNSTTKEIWLESAETIANKMHCDTLTTLTTSHDDFKESPLAYVGMASKFMM